MPDLKKVLNRWDSIAIITAIVIGVGVFRVPSQEATTYTSGKVTENGPLFCSVGQSY